MCEHCNFDKSTNRGKQFNGDYNDLSYFLDRFVTAYHQNEYYWNTNSEDHHSLDSIEINYCPFCGRKLNDQ